MPLYSILIARGLIASGATVNGPTVPAGFVWILRDVETYNNSATAGTFLIGLAGSGQPIIVDIPLVTTNLAGQWKGRAVLQGGDGLAFRNTSTGQVSYYVSGYQLPAS